MTDPDLQRFIDAQRGVHEQVARELEAGRKRSHWMWFVFPQLEGLGHSAMAQAYAIRDLDQARRYLADPALGARLRDDVRRIMRHAATDITAILGSPDDVKFRSCLTLFARAAPTAEERRLFEEALAAFYEGPDARTLALLGHGPERG
jgi:uncharacterized protein (DUF1810 family)